MDSMKQENKFNKLMKQIMKFGVVGGLAFLIDFSVLKLLCLIFGDDFYLIASAGSFTVSLVFNYLASMKFVFESKEGMDKRKEFFIFLILSLIGMAINTAVMWVCKDGIYENWAWLKGLLSEGSAISLSKIGATGIVMIYNFISRKVFLEKKEA